MNRCMDPPLLGTPWCPARAAQGIARQVSQPPMLPYGGSRPTRYPSHGPPAVPGPPAPGDAIRRDRPPRTDMPAACPAGERLKVTIVAANTFQYDARQLRTARALAGDGHQVTLVGFAATGLPARDVLDGGIALRRVPVDTDDRERVPPAAERRPPRRGARAGHRPGCHGVAADHAARARPPPRAAATTRRDRGARPTRRPVVSGRHRCRARRPDLPRQGAHRPAGDPRRCATHRRPVRLRHRRHPYRGRPPRPHARVVPRPRPGP